jgi:hypothetical protein
MRHFGDDIIVKMCVIFAGFYCGFLIRIMDFFGWDILCPLVKQNTTRFSFKMIIDKNI